MIMIYLQLLYNDNVQIYTMKMKSLNLRKSSR